MQIKTMNKVNKGRKASKKTSNNLSYFLSSLTDILFCKHLLYSAFFSKNCPAALNLEPGPAVLPSPRQRRGILSC